MYPFNVKRCQFFGIIEGMVFRGTMVMSYYISIYSIFDFFFVCVVEWNFSF